MAEVEYAVRFHSEYGSHVVRAESRKQAETWAAIQAKQPGYWAELLSRSIPNWIVIEQFGGAASVATADTTDGDQNA